MVAKRNAAYFSAAVTAAKKQMTSGLVTAERSDSEARYTAGDLTDCRLTQPNQDQTNPTYAAVRR